MHIQNIIRWLLLSSFLWLASPAFAGITLNETSAEISFAPTCNHVPISVGYTPTEFYDESLISVSSSANWAIPFVNTDTDQIEIAFSTRSLIASYNASIYVDDGETIKTIMIQAKVGVLDIFRLVDDPLRSKTYGIQRNGIDRGSIISYDAIQEDFIECITVGEGPTDFVINSDSTELLVINSVSQSIDVIDLASFSLKETIALPVYNAWGDPDDTTANIDLGPDGIIYYSDGAWAPQLHLLDRSSGEVLQTASYNGGSGFLDFAVTSDKLNIVALPQYGWSAGSHKSTIAQYAIEANGTITFVKETNVTGIARAPFEAPVLIREDDEVAVLKTISTDPADTDLLVRSFPSAIWSMNPNGTVVATGDRLYEFETGIELLDIPGGTTSSSGYIFTRAQAFTSDFSRFVYFDSNNRSLEVINLIEEVGLDLIGRELSPTNNSIVNAPTSLSWSSLNGVSEYDVYLSSDELGVTSADETSSAYLGRVSAENLELLETLTNGTQYFWRVDPVTLQGPETGLVYNFTVSDIALDKPKVEGRTVAVHANFLSEIELSSEFSGVSWSVVANDSWVSFVESSGTSPSTLQVYLDATQLLPGTHSSSITMTTDSAQIQIPVSLSVEELNLTHIRSDRNSQIIYAISEDLSEVESKAYLLEINSSTEDIERIVPVGSFVTDIAISYSDDLVFINNWKSGTLLYIDRLTLEHLKNATFTPAGPTGYGDDDVYRVAAGVSERLVIEEEDQWIEISLYNSSTETVLDEAFVREGGGAFEATGRYYYHGENNSSGASIIKFDTAGDVLTQLAEVRPSEISSYYGSRTVVISEDGSRIFWGGVVLDSDLNTEWGIGEIIYSTSADGRLAFGNESVYDIDLQEHILTLPETNGVSGYNSTTNKLMIQTDGELAFYTFGEAFSLVAPVLSVNNPTYDTVDLSWPDESLETAFEIQQRESGADIWSDIGVLAANQTSFVAGNLLDDTIYDFRVRATASDDNVSSWSNIVSLSTLKRPNIIPVARDDYITVYDLETIRFSPLSNDFDNDGSIVLDSIEITEQAQFGVVKIHSNGELSYTPGENFLQSDSFKYIIKDNEGASSEAAHINIYFYPTPIPAPSLLISFLSDSTIGLEWVSVTEGLHYELEQRVFGTSTWDKVQSTPKDVFSWDAEGLESGQTYEYRVRGLLSGNVSTWSNIAIATVLAKEKEPEEKGGGGSLNLFAIFVLLGFAGLLRFRGL